MLERRRFLAHSGSAAAMAAFLPAGLAPRTVAAGLVGDPDRERAGDSGTPRSGLAMVWHDVAAWGVEGRGWADTAAYYDRLPARAEGLVRDPVWQLSRHSAGMFASFETDASEIQVRYTLRSDRLDMAHMPATGVSGVDLYGLDGERWRWAAVFKPTGKANEGSLIRNLDGGARAWRTYLPLYNGVESFEIGVPEGASFAPIAPRTAKPIAFYGTSILHGACASRPGMAWPSIVGRRLGVPTLNLGFSGNGRMEPEIASLLAELDAAAFVIDCAPNMNGEQILERAGHLVRTLRAARPGAPIVLVEDRRYGYAWVQASARQRNEGNREALRRVFEELRESGVPGLAYIETERLLGADFGEAMTDGSHPNDLGMMRYADAVTPVLKGLLG
ncbi:MAG: SGNH/GDSL hydrolase family protein [Phycisphaerales bacterium JB041]